MDPEAPLEWCFNEKADSDIQKENPGSSESSPPITLSSEMQGVTQSKNPISAQRLPSPSMWECHISFHSFSLAAFLCKIWSLSVCLEVFSTVLFSTLLVAGFHSCRSFHTLCLSFPILDCSSLLSMLPAKQTGHESLLLALLGTDQLTFLLCVLQNIFVMKQVMDEYSIIWVMFRKEQCDNGNATEQGSFTKAK